MEGLIFFDHWPSILNSLNCEDLFSHFGKPLLIHINSNDTPPIVISTLLHGNEHSGYEALKLFMAENTKIEKNLIILIGNIQAAQLNLRQLPNGHDFNRLWSDDIENPPCFVVSIKKYLLKLSPALSIDIHNNTGRNPFYSCISKTKDDHLKLASFFGECIVYFTEPHSAFSVYFSNFFPSITIEAGLSKDIIGIKKIVETLNTVIKNNFEMLLPNLENKKIYHTIGKVKIPPYSTLSITDSNIDSDFNFSPKLDEKNFKHIFPNEVLGHATKLPIVLNDDNQDVATDFLQLKGDKLILSREVVPAMLTANESIIMSDGLCYFMEEYSYRQS